MVSVDRLFGLVIACTSACETVKGKSQVDLLTWQPCTLVQEFVGFAVILDFFLFIYFLLEAKDKHFILLAHKKHETEVIIVTRDISVSNSSCSSGTLLSVPKPALLLWKNKRYFYIEILLSEALRLLAVI